MSAKENKGSPVRWIRYIKWNPRGAYMLIKKLCKFNFEIPSAQSKERNIITQIHNDPKILKSSDSREVQLFMSWKSVRHFLCRSTLKRKCEIPSLTMSLSIPTNKQ